MSKQLQEWLQGLKSLNFFGLGGQLFGIEGHKNEGHKNQFKLFISVQIGLKKATYILQESIFVWPWITIGLPFAPKNVEQKLTKSHELKYDNNKYIRKNVTRS